MLWMSTNRPPPQAKKDPKWNKKQAKKPKGWQYTEPLEEEFEKA